MGRLGKLRATLCVQPRRKLDASNQFPSFSKGPVSSSRTSVKSLNNAGRAGRVGVGVGRGRRAVRGCSPDPGRPRAGLASGARTRTPSCTSAGRWPFLLQYKGSLLRSHKSRQEPLFQQALWANRRNSAEFPNGPRSLEWWERLKERGIAGLPPSSPQTTVHIQALVLGDGS